MSLRRPAAKLPFFDHLGLGGVRLGGNEEDRVELK
jgi:hypothetical protein